MKFDFAQLDNDDVCYGGFKKIKRKSKKNQALKSKGREGFKQKRRDRQKEREQFKSLKEFL